MLVLVFYLGDVMYIIKHHHIREISPMVKLKQIPQSPSYFAGFFNYRDTLVPVLDLRQLLHHEPCRMRLSTRIILLDYRLPGQTQPQTLGLIAEQVTETLRKSPEDFITSNLLLNKNSYLDEVIMENNQVIQCINLQRLAEQLHQARLPQQPAKPLNYES